MKRTLVYLPWPLVLVILLNLDCGHLDAVAVKYSGPFIEACATYGYAELDGSMNIFVKPISANITQVRINARYVFKANDDFTVRYGLSIPERTIVTNLDKSKRKLLVAPTHKAERTILEGIKSIAKGIQQ